MKFFNLDLHISVISDIKKILEDLGHSVTNWSISGHASIMGWQRRDDCVINQFNWRQLDKSMCDKFYDTYKGELKDIDCFIVTHTPSFALLYEKFNKPIIVINSTRYEAPFYNDMMKWTALNRYLQSGIDSGKILFFANNKYDALYTEYFINRDIEIIPSLCEYTGAKYTGKREQLLYVSRFKPDIAGLWDKPNKVFHKEQALQHRHSWQDLADFKGIIHIPYNVSMMSIFEQYTANCPLFFPDKELMLKLMETNNSGVLSEISWNQVFRLPPFSAIPSFFNDPNRYNELSIMEEWIRYADFYDDEWMPNIILFSSFKDLNEKIKTTDYRSVVKKMLLTNKFRKEYVINKWKEVLGVIE